MLPLRPFGPAMPTPRLTDALRAACGAALGLLACEGVLHLITSGAGLAHLLLIAPLGATAFLVFVVPNSPLAQPWSAIVGNGVAALCALVALTFHLPLAITVALATLIAILAMAALRAFHPPAGAVALATVIAAQSPDFPGLIFVLSPVLAGTTALVAVGLLWHRATGRTYPFRQPPQPPQTSALPNQNLTRLLENLRLSPNIGVGDLARLLSATDAAAHPLANITADSMMTRQPVTVRPDMPLADLARLFREHRFKTLPMINADGRYLGLIDQSALLGLTDPSLTAATLATQVAPLPPKADATLVLDHLTRNQPQAVPIASDDRLVGLVTRSDVISRLAASLHNA